MCQDKINNKDMPTPFIVKHIISQQNMEERLWSGALVLLLLVELAILCDDPQAGVLLLPHPAVLLLVEHQLEPVLLAGQAVLARRWPVLGGREQQVQAQLEGVVQHPGNHLFQHKTGCLDAGVGVDFNKPGLEVPVDHEVQPEDLEDRATHLVPLHQMHCGLDGVGGNVPHLGHDLLFEIVAHAGILAVQVLLELGVGDLVAILILPIAFRMVLDCVVGEVHEGVEVVQLELEGAGPDVPLAVPVPLHCFVLHYGMYTIFTRSMQHLMSNFLRLYRNGLSMQAWMMYVRFFVCPSCESRKVSPAPTMLLISSCDSWTVMPLPLLEFSPGFRIQMLLWPSFLNSSYFSVNFFHDPSSRETTWKVSGSFSKTSMFFYLQQWLMLQKSAFLLPRYSFCGKWLWQLTQVDSSSTMDQKKDFSFSCDHTKLGLSLSLSSLSSSMVHHHLFLNSHLMRLELLPFLILTLSIRFRVSLVLSSHR